MFKKSLVINTKKIENMKNLTTKYGLVYTSVNQFSNKDKYMFFKECQLAYNVLDQASAEMKSEEFEKEAWTDIMIDNSEPNNQKFFAVYGEGSVTSDADCIYIEVEPNAAILNQVDFILIEHVFDTFSVD